MNARLKKGEVYKSIKNAGKQLTIGKSKATDYLKKAQKVLVKVKNKKTLD